MLKYGALAPSAKGVARPARAAAAVGAALDHTDRPSGSAKRSSLHRAIKSAKVRVGLGPKLLKWGGQGGPQEGHRPPQKGVMAQVMWLCAGGANVQKFGRPRGPDQNC